MNKKKISKDRNKGFTLVETLVSIAIFGVISVLMSNIVIRMSKFSLDNERRNDFLAQLDNAANIAKNDLRGAESIGICDAANIATIYRISRVDTSGTAKKFGLQLIGNRLRWAEMTSVGCAFRTDSTPPVPVFQDLTNINYMRVSSVSVTKSDDGNITNPNTLVYIKIEACDPDINGQRKVFDCVENPYRYIFSITTRNVQS